MDLFSQNTDTTKKRKKNDFYDYDSFVAKFKDAPKTTDDCYTPRDVYEAVVDYVDKEICSLSDKRIIRPFYPGGDYENAEYPADGVVIDNPPFSILNKIVAFYMRKNIPFFLFGNGMTILDHCKKGATAVICGTTIEYENGAKVISNFVTNLVDNSIAAMTAPGLVTRIENCPSQNKKTRLVINKFPKEVISVSKMQTLANGLVHFEIRRSDCLFISKLLNSKDLFGVHLLVKENIGIAAERAAERAADYTYNIKLSELEEAWTKKK